ncbi:DUF7332 family protein [Natrinema marinum]|uniref:DUF7332 family protein n=1 Tax=Natrinema marinum TaxID=2961598 RepID=UPI0020C89460|nr:hypothetical protein [Natrinema marinum]
MVRARRTRVLAVALCCLILFAPIATATQQSGSQAQNESNTSTANDAAGQRVSTCFTGSGTEFTIGAEDGTNIWIRMHAAMLTGSGWSIGAELVGSTNGNSIIEVVAGIQYVGDGFLDFLSDPVGSFDLVQGFGFQLPMLENVGTGIGETGTDRSGGETGNQSAEGSESADGDESQNAQSRSDDSPFELLRC